VIFLRRAIGFILLFLITPLLLAQEEEQQEIDIERLRERILDEAPLELMVFTLGDAEVSLFLTGSWAGILAGNLGFTYSPLGYNFASAQAPLFFEQEVDLTMSLWINDKWFLEAGFQDDSALSTYRAGYQGLSGEFLQYAGLGNTGLDFPSFTYLSLGGDTPSSFGFYSRFGTENLNLHALVRYDAAAREERTFIGGRERTFADIELQNTVRGVSFILPDEQIDSEIIVYIEDQNGAVRDNSGRRWRNALPSEYAASRAQGILELSVRPHGMVAVIYQKNGGRPWINSMGVSYNDAQKFLHSVQSWFGQNKNLADYPQCGGGGSIPGEVIFGAEHALVLYEPGAFSPFERQNRYDAPSSSSESADLVQLSTGQRVNGFEFVMLANNALHLSSGGFAQDSSPVSRLHVFELYKSEGGVNPREPVNSWPLALEYPEIYLPPKSVFTGDLVIRFINLNSASGYYIGDDVIPVSIQVWRSGIEDTNFGYNSSSGEVSIRGSIGHNELIRITFLNKSGSARTGSIAAGLGAVYQKAGSPFSAQTAVGILWNLTDDSYTKEDESNMGTVGISARAALNYDFLKAHIAAGYNFVQTDTTGLYRAAGMEGNETILGMSIDSSFISNTPNLPGLTASSRADLIYRNYYNDNIFDSGLMNIEADAPVVSGINRPYPVFDSHIKRPVITAEFNLDAEKNWTGFQIPLVNYSEIFSYAQEIEIPFRFYDLDDYEKLNLKLILQIGSLSGNNLFFTENPDLIWEKILFPDDINTIYFDSGNYRIARFKLTEEDRLKLGNAVFLRLIAVNEGSSDLNGRVLLAPPIIRSASFRAVTYDGTRVTGNSRNVRALETPEGVNALETAFPDIVKRFHVNLNAQRVLRIEIENTKTGISAGADGRLTGLPLSNYRELSFFIKLENNLLLSNNETLSLTIASGPDTINNYQLHARIPMSAFLNNEGRWSKVTLRYNGTKNEVSVNGIKIPDAFIDYKPNALVMDTSSVNSSYIAILINPENEFQSLKDSIFFIDEIILEDPISLNRINAGTSVAYSRPGVLLSAGNVPLLADISISTAVETETRIENTDDDVKVNASVINKSETGVSVLGVKLSGNLAFTSADDSFSWNAGHAVSRSFGPLSLSETFSVSPQTASSSHNVNLSLLTDFYTNFTADVNYEFSKLIQKWNFGIGYRNENIFIPAVSISAQAVWRNDHEFEQNKNYGELWISSFEPLVPDSGNGADNRRINSQVLLTQRTIPVGASLGFEGNSNFTAVNNITRSDYAVWLDVPVTLEKFNFNFKSGRSFKRDINFSGIDALDDAQKYLESVSGSFPFWEVFPFYSLFAKELNHAMDKSLDSFGYAQNIFYMNFIDHFSTRVNLPSVYNPAAFFIPSRISFRIERVLEQKMDVKADSLNLNGNINFSAINMFGAMGYFPVFKFYQSGEYNHVIDVSVNIPYGENVSWRIQSAVNVSFRGFTGGVLSFSNSFSIRAAGNKTANNYWTESFSASWETQTKRNLLSGFYDWIVNSAEKQSFWFYSSSIFNKNYEQLRRETIAIVFDKSSDYLTWTITAGHEEIIRILGRLNLCAFINLRLNNDEQKETFTLDFQLGTALKIFF